jgi:UDP-N-acetylmuramoyl-L-alanyl-D-glutamate--2,6-diaminopimelate ligase
MRSPPTAGSSGPPAPIAALYFGEPTRELDVLAVTGTNGKTSTAWWLAQALSQLEAPHTTPCGVVGTLGIGRPPQVEFTGLTTPDPVLLQRMFRRFVEQGLKACAIEASSVGHRGAAHGRHAGPRRHLHQFHAGPPGLPRLDGALLGGQGRTLPLARLRAAVINLDDEKGEALAQALQGTGLELWTFSCVREARLRAHAIGYGPQGLRFEIEEGGQREALQTSLIGQYNVSNLLGVIGAMRALGVPLAAAVRGCAHLLPVPGRMERLNVPDQPLVAGDYAHTPDALDKALAALRPLAAQRGGQLWCVFGCGGDRDPTKRPLMAAVAEKNADRVVVTSDNPRSEKPEAIISQILLGLSHHQCVEVQADRARAIADTVAAAAPADVILLAGKGHEDYQEVAGVKHPFSDQAHAQAALVSRAGSAA